MSFKIDRGGCTFLPICNTCGWRGLPATSPDEAWREARHHEMRAHEGQKAALRAGNNQRHRMGA